MKNAFCLATALYGSAALPFVIPSAPRISYCAAPETATCAAFVEESRMKFADHTKLDRKSGEAEGSAVPRTFLGTFFDGAQRPEHGQESALASEATDFGGAI
jgi:hypothetical protein